MTDAEGTLYHHFGSKDGIFLTLFEETMEGFLAGIDMILARGATGRETAEMLRGSFYGTTRLKMLDLIQAPFPRLARMMETYWLKALAP